MSRTNVKYVLIDALQVFLIDFSEIRYLPVQPPQLSAGPERTEEQILSSSCPFCLKKSELLFLSFTGH